MPIYEYRCGSCGAEFDLLVRADTVLACPVCEGLQLDRKLSLTARPAAGAPTANFSQLGPPPGGCCGGGACHNH
jgi:putative FmdB family regulatory protein